MVQTTNVSPWDPLDTSDTESLFGLNSNGHMFGEKKSLLKYYMPCLPAVKRGGVKFESSGQKIKHQILKISFLITLFVW